MHRSVKRRVSHPAGHPAGARQPSPGVLRGLYTAIRRSGMAQPSSPATVMPPDNGWAADGSLTRPSRISRIRDAGLAGQVIRSPSFIRAPPCNVVVPSISEHHSRTRDRTAVSGRPQSRAPRERLGARSTSARVLPDRARHSASHWRSASPRGRSSIQPWLDILELACDMRADEDGWSIHYLAGAL
jgi:hypothetical protein